MKDLAQHTTESLMKEVSQIKQSLTEAEKNLPLADRSPRRVLGVKKMWKANRHRRTL